MRSIDSWRAARSAGRVLHVPLQRRSGSGPRLDQRSQRGQPQPRARASVRRHGDVRRRRRSRADGAGRSEPQEGHRPHLGRQRHQQPPERAAKCGRWSARPKCWSTRSASTARANRRSRAAGAADHAAATVADSVPDSRRRAAAAARSAVPDCRGTGGVGGGGMMRGGADDRVNVVALREITDDSGGRTEIVRDPRDLDPATLSIADELSKQYYIGYPEPGSSRRPLAQHPRRSCAIARSKCARGAATSPHRKLTGESGGPKIRRSGDCRDLQIARFRDADACQIARSTDSPDPPRRLPDRQLTRLSEPRCLLRLSAISACFRSTSVLRRATEPVAYSP